MSRPTRPTRRRCPKPALEAASITASDLITRYALELERGDALVERVMVGANVLDANGFPADPDFHWSAIDTATLCVILTGNFEPISYLLAKSGERHVPVLDKDTLDVMNYLEDIFPGPTLASESKPTAFTSLMQRSVDPYALAEALGMG